MPSEDENTEGKKEDESQTDPLRGTKFEGKSSAEIAAAYAELEALQGRQGDELGRLRAENQIYRASQTREPARKDEYTENFRKLADELIVNPEEVLPKLAEEIERRAVEKATRISEARVTSAQALEAFFRANPDLDEYRREVSTIGEMIYQANPGLPLSQVLEITASEARKWVGSMRDRLQGRKAKDAERKRAGVTTSGGRAREGEADQHEESEVRSSRSPEEQVILDEIKSLRETRAKRAIPPHTR